MIRKAASCSNRTGADDKCIRVLLEPGTVVMVKNMHSFVNWKARYPEARILNTDVSDASESEAGMPEQ
jgi:hypothetical protein